MHLFWVGKPDEPALNSLPPVTQRIKYQYDVISLPLE